MEPLHEKKVRQLEEMATTLREDVIRELVAAGSGHSAGPLGMADIFTAFYFHILKHNPKKPNWADRDRLVLSNGHICPILYAALARAGYFPVEELSTLRHINTRLQGHPHRGALPGVETTSGPLGSGLSQAIGMALAARLDHNPSTRSTNAQGGERGRTTSSGRGRHRVYCFMSDGEQQEGNIWEAAMLAGKLKLSNITAVMDRNGIQIDGVTEDVMPLEPLRAKYESFNWNVVDVDGHSFEAICAAVAEAHAVHERPTLIIAHTIPGRGVSFMERDYRWHGKPPTREEAERALKELKARRERVVAKYR